jgi:hypothetical protein
MLSRFYGCLELWRLESDKISIVAIVPFLSIVVKCFDCDLSFVFERDF